MSDSLPANWSEAALGDLVSVCRPKSDPQDFPDMPFVGMDNVEAQTMRLLGTVPAGTMRSNAIHFFPQDVLYGRLRPYLNKVLAPTFEGLASAEFIPLTPEPGIERDFVRYRVNAADFVYFTSHLDEGDRPRVDWNGIRQFQVSLPPSAEQRRIVEAIDSYLTRLDDAVASLGQVQAKLKTYRASVLKAAVEGRLVPTEASLACAEKRDYEPASALVRKGESPDASGRKRAGRLWGAGVVPDLNDIERSHLPAGWCWAKVRELGPFPDEVVQVGPMSMRSKDFADDGVMVLNVGCVQWGHVDEAKADKLPEKIAQGFGRYRVKSGDVLFTRSGTVGRSAVIKEGHSDSLITFHLLRVRTSPDRCLPEYLQMVFQGAPHVRRQTREASIGTTRAGFNTMLLAMLDVPLPPLVEQRRIVGQVDALLSEVEACEGTVLRTARRCARLRQAVLKWAFEGKLVDQDATDEPAERLLARIKAARASVAPIAKNSRGKAKGAA